MTPISETHTNADPEESPWFQPERVLRPRQQVQDQIKRAILSGVLKQGDRLPSEVRLAEEFSVSRATVREALRSLAEAGLISKVAGSRGGSFVEYVDHHAIASVLSDRLSSTLELGSISYEEVAEFRDLLEVPSARLAAVNRTDEQIQELRTIIDREKALSVDDPAIPELNASFHSCLAEASGNRVLAAAIQALHRVARPLHFIETSAELGRDSVVQHIAIVRSVEEHDAAGAETNVRAHLDYLRSHVA